MTVWRAVQEALYGRWNDLWVEAAIPPDPAEPTSPTQFANEDPIDPPEGLWVKFEVQRRPGGNGTLGSPGKRKMDRRGVAFIRLREPPSGGSGNLADYAQRAADIFENCRIDVHGLRFATVDIGEAGDVDQGRWWGVTVEAPFDYEETK